MRLYITKKDIENGLKYNARWCPIALSFRRRFKNALVVAVAGSAARVGKRSFYLTTSFVKFQNDFDGGVPVKPFSALVSVQPK